MVEKKKKNTLEKMIENLRKDEATLVQLLETSSSLRQPHQVPHTVWRISISCVSPATTKIPAAGTVDHSGLWSLPSLTVYIHSHHHNNLSY